MGGKSTKEEEEEEEGVQETKRKAEGTSGDAAEDNKVCDKDQARAYMNT